MPADIVHTVSKSNHTVGACPGTGVLNSGYQRIVECRIAVGRHIGNAVFEKIFLISKITHVHNKGVK